MITKDAYKQKIEAELDMAEAKMTEFKAQMKLSSADAQLNYAKHIENLDHGIEATKIKLKELGEAGEDAWERIQEGVESAWGSLSDAVKDASAIFNKK